MLAEERGFEPLIGKRIPPPSNYFARIDHQRPFLSLASPTPSQPPSTHPNHCKPRTAFQATDSDSVQSRPANSPWAECHGRAAVVIKPVSADSLPKTGIFADKAGDFRRFPPQARQSGSPETKRMREKPGFPAHSRVSWEAWPNAGLGGCLGRDRTQTFPIEFRPLKYQENFASKASFSCPETFRPSCNRSGSLETTREKRIGTVFRALDSTRGSLLSSTSIARRWKSLQLENEAFEAKFSLYFKGQTQSGSLKFDPSQRHLPRLARVAKRREKGPEIRAFRGFAFASLNSRFAEPVEAETAKVSQPSPQIFPFFERERGAETRFDHDCTRAWHSARGEFPPVVTARNWESLTWNAVRGLQWFGLSREGATASVMQAIRTDAGGQSERNKKRPGREFASLSRVRIPSPPPASH